MTQTITQEQKNDIIMSYVFSAIFVTAGWFIFLEKWIAIFFRLYGWNFSTGIKIAIFLMLLVSFAGMAQQTAASQKARAKAAYGHKKKE